MAIHRHGGIKVCAERAVVFGIHAPEVNAQPRHAADTVGQQSQIGGLRIANYGLRIGWEKMNRRRNFLRRCGVTFQNQFRLRRRIARRKGGNVAVADSDGLDVQSGRALILTSDF